MTDQIAWAGKVSFAGSVMLAGLLSQSYDTRKPSVFVYFPLLDLISFNGQPQATVSCLVSGYGSLVNQVLSCLV